MNGAMVRAMLDTVSCAAEAVSESRGSGHITGACHDWEEEDNESIATSDIYSQGA